MYTNNENNKVSAVRINQEQLLEKMIACGFEVSCKSENKQISFDEIDTNVIALEQTKSGSINLPDLFLSKVTDVIENGKPSVILMQGAPGSGKSYFLNEILLFLQKKDFVSTSPDSTIEKKAIAENVICDEDFYKKHYKKAIKESDSIINLCLDEKRNIIIDKTNSNREKFLEFVALLKERGFNVIVVVMDVAKEICIERNSKRDRKVAKVAVYSHSKKLLEFSQKDYENVDVLWKFSEQNITKSQSENFSFASDESATDFNDIPI